MTTYLASKKILILLVIAFIFGNIFVVNAATTPQCITNACIKPILECVTKNSNNTYTAWFGYENDNTVNITIAVGTKNGFSPTPQNRGQPTTFLPGRQIKVFSFTFSSGNQVWTLTGPDNQTRTSTASPSSPSCTPRDTIPPTITPSLSPKPNTNGWNNTAVVVSFSCTDNGSGVAQCPTPQTINQQGKTITVTGTGKDSAGNVGTATVILKIDLTAPKLTISQPVNPFLTNQTSVTIQGKATDSLSGLAKVTCNGTAIAVTNSNFSTTVSLVEGKNSIILIAKDSADNSTYDTLIITRDTQPPIVKITSPMNGSLTNKTPVPVSWTVDGVLQTTQTTQTLVEGQNKIIRTATDAAGNIGKDSIVITLDTKPPVVKITAPVNGIYTNKTPINVSWTVDGINQTTQLTQILIEGVNTIIRSATDSAGNIGKDSVHVVLDTKPPVVIITSPANGFLTNKSPVAVAWTVDGVVQTTQLTQSLNEGANTITRTATDSAGNVGTASITVRLKTTLPVVVITSPVNGFLTNKSPVVV